MGEIARGPFIWWWPLILLIIIFIPIIIVIVPLVNAMMN
jgi:hypothetical protein